MKKTILTVILSLVLIFACACSNETELKCPNCEKAISQNVKFCSNCGYSFDDNDSSSNNIDNNSNNSSSSNNDNMPESPPTKIYVEQCIKNVPGITEYEFVTEETDPMNNINKPGWYIEYVYFSYILVNQSNILGDSLLDKGTYAGGSIEIYSTKQDALQRNEYLKTFDGTVLSAGTHIVYDFCVVRTSDELTASQQKFLENNIIFALKGENSKIINLENALTESETNGYSQGLEFKINSDNESYSLISKGECDDTNIRIPQNFNNLPVTRISNTCFRNDEKIIAVEIPGSIVSLSSYAFENCSNLKSVTILNGTETIGYNAFENCVSLEQISIPQSVDYIGISAFYNCPILNIVNCENLSSWCNIYFGNSYANPTCYSKKLYLNYNLITHLIIPNDVTQISSYAFCNCNSILSIEIHSGVSEIYESAFQGCTQLQTKENGITYVDNWVIYCDKNTTTTTLRNNTVGIGWRAFYNCHITNIIIPNSVKHINPTAFSFSSLKTITLSNSITKIAGSTFYGCSNLQEISIPNSVKVIGYASFYGCYALETINLPQNLEEISAEAFWECKKLSNITIPHTLTKIGNCAFTRCYDFQKIYYCGNMSDWQKITIEDGNSSLPNAIIYYYSENNPTTIGNYWHYENNVISEW